MQQEAKPNHTVEHSMVYKYSNWIL